jgi:hypothetical protein
MAAKYNHKVTTPDGKVVDIKRNRQFPFAVIGHNDSSGFWYVEGLAADETKAQARVNSCNRPTKYGAQCTGAHMVATEVTES